MSNKEKWLRSYIISQVFLLILVALYFALYFFSALNNAVMSFFGGEGICTLEAFVPILVWNIIIDPPVFRLILEVFESFSNEESEDKE